MSSISTFGAFTTARLGIYVSQQALTITGNNISNLNTSGYTRQKLDQASLYMGGSDRYVSPGGDKIGAGAVATSTSQMRDPYLDIRYRTEISNVGSADAKLSSLRELADVLDEVGGGEDGEGVIEAAFNNLIEQMENLATSGAGKDDYDTLVRSAAASLCSMFNDYANQLDTLYNNQLTGLKQDVDNVNTILKNIAELSSEIRKAEIHGASALELKDQRNTLIDNLSEYVAISVTYEQEIIAPNIPVDKLVISLSGRDEVNPDANHAQLVNGVYATQLRLEDEPLPPAGNLNISLEPLYSNKGELMNVASSERLAPSLNAMKETAAASAALQKALDDDAAQAAAGGTAQYPAHAPGNPGLGYVYAAVKDPVDGKWYVQQAQANGAGTPQYIGDPLTLENAELTSRNEAQEMLANLMAAHPDDYPTRDPAVNPDGNAVTYQYRVTLTNGEFIINKTTFSPSTSVQLHDNTLYGAIQSEREMLTERGEYADAAMQADDPNAPTKRGILYYKNALDTLAVSLARLMNESNHLDAVPVADLADPAKLANMNLTADTVFVDAAGSYFKLAVGSDQNGNLAFRNGTETDDYQALGIPLDTATKVDIAALAAAATDANRVEIEVTNKGGPLFSSSGNTDDGDLSHINASNISVAKSWSSGAVRILQSTNPDHPSMDNTNLTHILTMLQGDQVFKANEADTDPMFTGSFQEFLTNHVVSTLATDQLTTAAMRGNYSTTADELANDRDSVSGVDLNDETINLMQYQKAYSAACRLMTVLDEVLDKLINGTAV